jgi:hypothetical protein
MGEDGRRRTGDGKSGTRISRIWDTDFTDLGHGFHGFFGIKSFDGGRKTGDGRRKEQTTDDTDFTDFFIKED